MGHLAAQLGLTNSLAPPSPPVQQSLTELQVGRTHGGATLLARAARVGFDVPTLHAQLGQGQPAAPERAFPLPNYLPPGFVGLLGQDLVRHD